MKKKYYYILPIILIIAFSSCSLFYTMRYESKAPNKKFIIDTTDLWDNIEGKFEKDSNGTFYRKMYSETGTLISLVKVRDTTKFSFYGELKRWYESGKIKRIINYNDSSELHGELTTFYETGQIKRKEKYYKDSLISGVCYDISGKEITCTPFESQPIANINEISSFITYPTEMIRQGIQEKLFLRVLVDKFGKPKLIYYDSLNSIEFVLSAIDCIKRHGKFTPAYIDDEPESTWFLIPVTFRFK